MYSTLGVAVWNFEVAQCLGENRTGLEAVWPVTVSLLYGRVATVPLIPSDRGEQGASYTNPHTHCGSSHVQIRDKRRLVSHNLIGVAVTVVNP